jgi:hypothetical protein
MLVTMALDALPAQVAALEKAGEDVSRYVWAFFDGRVSPGRNVALMHLREQGASPEVAAQRLDAGIKEARSKGSIFALGLMLPSERVIRFLTDLGGNRESLAPIERWIADVVPPGAIRAAVITGPTMQLLHALPRGQAH